MGVEGLLCCGMSGGRLREGKDLCGGTILIRIRLGCRLSRSIVLVGYGSLLL
jgi:hypothetical protein